MVFLKRVLGVLCVMLASACGDDDGGGNTPIHLSDSGMSDTGSTSGDGGTTGHDSGGTTGHDSGPGGGECIAEAIPLFSVTACASSTTACFQDCSDSDCRQACLDADPDSETCLLCINQNIESCAKDVGGCEDTFEAFYCCLDDNCPDDGSCGNTTCASQSDAWTGCINDFLDTESSSECADEFSACFER